MNNTLTQKEKFDFISKSIQKHRNTTSTPFKPFYILYKDYSDLTKKRLLSQGDLTGIIDPDKPMYGITTTNQQYMQNLKNNGFTLIHTYKKFKK